MTNAPAQKVGSDLDVSCSESTSSKLGGGSSGASISSKLGGSATAFLRRDCRGALWCFDFGGTADLSGTCGCEDFGFVFRLTVEQNVEGRTDGGLAIHDKCVPPN